MAIKNETTKKTTTTATKSTKATVAQEVTPVAVETKDKEFESLKNVVESTQKENAELKNTVNELMETMKAFMATKSEESVQATKEKDDIDATDLSKTFGQSFVQEKNEEGFVEPSPDKQIQIVSTTYGRLNLSTNRNRSAGRLLTFDKYGQVKSVMYRELVDIVNAERKFAEQGCFYILDKSAVFFTGLTQDYKKLMNADIMDNILDYSISTIKEIVSVIPETQQKTLSRRLIDKVAKDESIDANKIMAISNIVGVKIIEKANELKEIQKQFDKDEK